MRILVSVLALLFGGSAASSAPLLLISIDGLRPVDVSEADRAKVAIPNLRRLLTEGSVAAGVVGVLPTVTYPSHATLLTGASPARHGIVNNTSFDPMNINQGGWYWYASDFKLPTLWDAAHAAGLITANVHWPTSVGARGITYNLPQIWRTGHGDDAKLVAALSTPGLLAPLELQLGPYAPGIDESIGGDETRGRFATKLIEDRKPDFVTVYLTALDHEQHEKGPGTPAVYVVLSRIDAIVGRLIAAARSAHPDTVVAVVSDHGFSTTSVEVNLFRAFIDADLITLDDDGKIKTWDAVPWNSGGSSAIMLARPKDSVLVARVAALLDTLKADPRGYIAAVIRAPMIGQMEGNPDASFYVSYSTNAYAGPFKGKLAPVFGPAKSRGTHGYFPATPEMRSIFMMMGPDIAKAHNYGVIDMRAIAPTLARVMGVKGLRAEVAALP
jgi:predicted AlkP superfamily pyrophosphatase or phosphodiesterase